MLEKFEQLMISEPVLRALNDMGFEEPTPIQQEAIPVAMSGKDMIGQAQTGTGKTAAFGLPVLERVDGNERHVQVVILSPTRELAMNITALPIYGGQDINRQFRALKKNPQIIVATPGRLMDHMDRGSIKFDHVKVVVLDEADEMLNMGFVDDINKILGAIPEDHQTLLFSATMPKAIQQLAETYLTEPTLIRMKPTQVTMDLIEQYYIEVQDRQKFDVLCRLFDIQTPELAIIFTRTKRRVDEVTEGLKKRGYMAEGIHGDLSQQKRDSVIRQFREGTIDILVATDVAARGLDISGVSHVYNYDMPQDPESYTHRVGRTGRAGKAGQAFTFVIPREMEHLHAIERLTKRKIARRRAPSLGEVLEGQQRLAIESLVEMTDNLEALAPFKSSAEELLNDTDSVTLLAAALKLLTKEPDTTPVNITEEKPLRVRRRRESGRSDRRRRDGDRRRDDRPRRSRDDRRSDRRNDRKGDRRRDDRKFDRPRGEKKTRHQSEGFKPYFKD
ncbi:DEAD/DEAH box helicase [Veillonella sp.]|uniref:DEAD/DEAH box helicase n=1 Tax=Veillonella sp. TaxID=1926307 RepID=UPI002911D276|nr:DEAD/DEAH box helicase [Veillonella sp.]MDU4116086.1 DEAD/DEAH box helicase [Veillonella sp.]